jgi:gag-polypeptide of LTR copia-type
MSPPPDPTTTDEDIILTAARPADIQIPKLSPTNYKVWNDLVVGLLDSRGVEGYIIGTVKKPTNRDQLRIWHQNNAVATSILKGTLSDSQLGHVMGIQDAQEVWTTLKRIHQRNDSAKVRSLLAKFMRFKLGPMDTIDGAASTLTRIQSEIASLKKAAEPGNDIKIEALLTALGPEYEPTIASLDTSTTLVYEDVVASLRKAEVRLKGPGIGDTNEARIVTGSLRSSRKTQSKGHEDSRRRQRCRGGST